MRLRDRLSSSLALGPGLFPALCVAVSLAASAPASATPMSIYNSMREAPITKFNKADMALLSKTVYDTLDGGADGAKVEWANPAGTSSGNITPAKDPKGRANCRLAQIENRYKTLQGSGAYIFCRNTKAKTPPWELIGPWTGA